MVFGDTAWELTAIIAAVVILLLLLTWLILRLVTYRKKKKKLQNHIDLYFDENFRNIIDEWDLVSRSKIKSWKKDIMKKLDYLGNDINSLKTRRERADKRMKALEKSLTSKTLPDTLRLKGMDYLARLYKKQNEIHKALPLWRDITTQKVSIAPFIELAMFYEHTEKDYHEALHWTLSAIDLITLETSHTHSIDLLPNLNHRLSRLKKKLSIANDSA